MQCPKCSSNTQILQTRAHSLKQRVQRRRECTECKHRFSSYEITKEDLAQMKKLMILATKFNSITSNHTRRLMKLTTIS